MNLSTSWGRFELHKRAASSMIDEMAAAESLFMAFVSRIRRGGVRGLVGEVIVVFGGRFTANGQISLAIARVMWMRACSGVAC